MPALGVFSNFPKKVTGIKARDLPSLADIEMMKRQGLNPDDLAYDRANWAGDMPELSDASLMNAGAQKGALAPMEPEKTGALASIKPKSSGNPANWLDYVSLAGATLSQVGGQGGAINDFLDRRRAMGQQQEMNSLLEGMDLSPEELGLVRAGMGKDVLAQRIGSQREDKVYDRNRADTVADMDKQHGWDIEGRDATFAHDDKRLDKTLSQDADQFRQTMGYNRLKMTQDQSQHDDEMALGYAGLDSKEAIEAAKAGRAGRWGAAQLAGAYNRGTNFIDEQEKTLADMKQIAAESRAYQTEAQDFNSQGQGITDAVGRWWSGTFGSGKVNQLARHTKVIASLMKTGNKGAWTDADQKNAESYVVNPENKPETNKFSAMVAENFAKRQEDYVSFLQDHLDPDDPTSLPEARSYWNEYARDVPLFNPSTGQPYEAKDLPSFDQWLSNKMQGQQQSMQQDWGLFMNDFMKDPKSIRQLEAEFDQVYGKGSARQLAAAQWGKDAIPALFGDAQ